MLEKKLKVIILAKLQYRALQFPSFITELIKVSKQEQNLLSLNNFLSPFNIIEFDIECALAYGKIRTELENKGQIIGCMDMLIASCSLAKDFTLITNNIKEFKRIKGLRVENWI